MKILLWKKSETLHKNRNVLVELTVKYLRQAMVWQSTKNIDTISKILAVLFFISCLSQSITQFASLADLQTSIDCFSVLSFCVMGFVKLISIRLNKTSLKTLHNFSHILEEAKIESDNDPIEYESDEDETDKTDEFIKKYRTDIQSVIGFAIPTFYWSTLVMFVIAPFTVVLRKDFDFHFIHILPTWLPFKENYLSYTFMILLELISSCYCVSVHVAFDCTCLGLMIFLSGQFSVLRWKILRIPGNGKFCLLSERRDKRALQRIVNCHQHHKILVMMLRDLNKILKPVMGVYFNVATLTLCATAVQLNTKLTHMQLLSLMQYMCATLTQLYLYCSFGDELMEKSDLSNREGIFCSSWWAVSPKVRRHILILSYGVTKPFKLQAGVFQYVHLPSFLAIVHRAYSIYALIRKKNINE